MMDLLLGQIILAVATIGSVLLVLNGAQRKLREKLDLMRLGQKDNHDTIARVLGMAAQVKVGNEQIREELTSIKMDLVTMETSIITDVTNLEKTLTSYELDTQIPYLLEDIEILTREVKSLKELVVANDDNLPDHERIFKISRDRVKDLPTNNVATNSAWMESKIIEVINELDLKDFRIDAYYKQEQYFVKIMTTSNQVLLDRAIL